MFCSTRKVTDWASLGAGRCAGSFDIRWVPRQGVGGSVAEPHLVHEQRAKAHPDHKGDHHAGDVVVVLAGVLLEVAPQQLAGLRDSRGGGGRASGARPRLWARDATIR